MTNTRNIIVVLNNIRSSENVGSIFRTADAAGVKKIILVGITPAPSDRFGRENKGLTKASLGAEKFVEWEKAENLKEAINISRKFFSEYSQKCTDKILLNFSSCSAQSASQGISVNICSKNFLVIGIEQDEKAIDYKKLKKLASRVSHLALVFGNEVEGLSKEDLKLCDTTAQLLMLGQKESLNVAVCAGIVLYSLA